MSVTSGFYNSDNHDRKYSVDTIGAMFDGIITDGVYSALGNKLIVKSKGGRTVSVGTGRARFVHSWVLNDAELPLEVPAAEAVLDRYDCVVLEIDRQDSVRAARIYIKTGVPSSVPEIPKLVMNSVLSEVPLAKIMVKHGATAIVQADITNLVGTSECPFVTGVLQQVTTDELVAQWESQFEGLIADLNKAIQGAKDGSGYVFKTGDTMTGNLDMGGNSITGLKDPVQNGDAVNLQTFNSNMPRMTLLWANAKPGAKFPAQSIQCPVVDYDATLVVSRVWKDSPRLVSSFSVSVAEGSTLGYDGELLCWRSYVKHNDRIQFDTGYCETSEASGYINEIANDNMVPCYIYGIKFGGAK